jgi:hypothetical protein
MMPHREFIRLGADPASRALAYRALFDGSLSAGGIEESRCHWQQQKVLGRIGFDPGLKRRQVDSLECYWPAVHRTLNCP